MDPVTITREVDLDVSVDELWSLIADGDRWADWLVDGGAVEITPGATGTVHDDGGSREVHILDVDHHERVTFDWWDGEGRSSVELEIVRTGERTGLRVTETFARAGAASARASTTWSVRLLVLCLGAAALSRT